MVEAGLIERTGPRGRGRRIGLQLTRSGAIALGRARPAVTRASRPADMGLTLSEQETLAALLVRVRDALDENELS
jgi:DNA-binding MarR family transcriptional regulator